MILTSCLLAPLSALAWTSVPASAEPVAASAIEAALFAPLEPAPYPAPALLEPMPSTSSPAPGFLRDGESESLLKYTYLEFGVVELDVDTIDDNVDQYYGRASLGLFDFLYVFGEYANQELDIQNTDAYVVTLGVGAHLDLSDRLNLIGEAAWLYNDISSDLSTLDTSDSGFLGRGGVRWLALPWDRGGIELDANLLYRELEGLSSDDSQLGWEAGGRVHFLELFSLGALYTDIEDDNQVAINARISF